jgi:hypothetical protein
MARHKIRNAGGQGPANAAKKLDDGARPTIDNPNPIVAPNGPKQTNTIVERANDPMGDGKLISQPMKGGAYGVIPEADTRVMFHNLVNSGGLRQTSGRPIARKPKTFIITGPVIGDGPNKGRVSFVYDKQRVFVLPGKEVTELSYDLDLLRRCGLKLEEVIDPLGEVQAELAAAEDPQPDQTDGDPESGDDGSSESSDSNDGDDSKE